MQPSFSPLAGDQIEKMHFQSWDWWASLVVCEVFCELIKIPNTLLHLVHLNFCSCWASGLVWKIWERSSKEWESDNQIYSPGDLIVECPQVHTTRHTWSRLARVDRRTRFPLLFIFCEDLLAGVVEWSLVTSDTTQDLKVVKMFLRVFLCSLLWMTLDRVMGSLLY